MLGALIKKEFTLIFRDLHGIAVLFIMPLAFVIIMSAALQDKYKKPSGDAAHLAFVYQKENPINEQLKSALINQHGFIITEHDAASNTQPIEYLIKNNAKLVLINPNLNIDDEAQLEVYALSNQDELLIASLNSRIRQTYLAIILQAKLSRALEQAVIPPTGSFQQDIEKISTKEATNLNFIDLKGNKRQKPSSSQYNVPAWMIFGMFFIVIPLSNIILIEKQTRTTIRFTLARIPIHTLLLGKFTPYLVINLLQCLLMFLIGIYVFPLIGIAPIDITGKLPELIILSLSLSIAAIGLAFVIATNANSTAQAVALGGGLNIILAAIGGIMVPLFIMPPFMQNLALLSPMHWALSGYQKILLGNADLENIIYHIFALLAFGFLSLMLSSVLYKRNNSIFR